MDRVNMSKLIEEKIKQCLDLGMTSKEEIITAVVDKLGVPRPTVRRVKRDLITKLQTKIKVLES